MKAPNSIRGTRYCKCQDCQNGRPSRRPHVVLKYRRGAELAYRMSTEPWLRGPMEEVHQLLTPILYSFQQAREDLVCWTEGLSTEQLWSRPLGLGAIGFHIRHIGGSVERLMTYAMGGQLTALQLAELEVEMTPGQTLVGLLADQERRFAQAEEQVRTLDPAQLNELREVGRKRLPSTLGGLLTHIAEHTQRHVGETIVTVRVVRATTIQKDTAPAHP